MIISVLNYDISESETDPVPISLMHDVDYFPARFSL